MEVRAATGDLTAIQADAVVVNLFEGATEPSGATGAVDKALGGVIGELMRDGEIKGKRGELTLIHTQGKMPSKRVVVAGLGKHERLDTDVVRSISAEVARFLRRKGIKKAASVVHGAGAGGLPPDDSAQAIAEGALLGLYRFRAHLGKEDDNGKGPEELLLLEREGERLPAIERGIERGRVMVEATTLARDLVNEPSNYMTPTILAERARQAAESCGLEFNVLEREHMEALGMGGVLGVAKGSHQPPKFIILGYKGDPWGIRSTLGLVGKGITFDSGGISLKPADGMQAMKTDMAGGAAVIAAMQAIARLKPVINVLAFVPATENMPGGGAQKPGDLLVAMNGKTVEVENTDAEGRLILADALSWAHRLDLRPVIDVATLTGAISVTLGKVAAGVFANNQEVADRIIAAGKRAGEKMWQLPMWEEYKELNRSTVADLKNTGGRLAGSIAAAQFLHVFVEETPWAHLDIAGVATTESEKGWEPRGATGQPVRSLINFVLGYAEQR